MTDRNERDMSRDVYAVERRALQERGISLSRGHVAIID